ncbi:hypothetical protein EYC59_05795 [Candidatus Saccharibacteria bacterium]|nr:MAG: hypothetical protein EYC59_05795 [Candidatus Saccharibacteria bacterium]
MQESDTPGYTWHERAAVEMIQTNPNGSIQLLLSTVAVIGAGGGTWYLLHNTAFPANREYETEQSNIQSIQTQKGKVEAALPAIPVDDTTSLEALQNTIHGYNQRISEATTALPVDYSPGLENLTTAPSVIVVGALAFTAVWKAIGTHAKRALARRAAS